MIRTASTYTTRTVHAYATLLEEESRPSFPIKTLRLPLLESFRQYSCFRFSRRLPSASFALSGLILFTLHSANQGIQKPLKTKAAATAMTAPQNRSSPLIGLAAGTIVTRPTSVMAAPPQILGLD